VVALARARLATDDTEGARKLVADYWRTAKLEAPQEAAFLKQFGTLLTRADHRFRMERMFYAERVNAGERAAKRAGTEQLAKAWGAMIREQREAGKLLQAVPAAQRDAGYHFAQAKYLRQRPRSCCRRRPAPTSWPTPTPGGSSAACCRANCSTSATSRPPTG
jgi:soluble lytic murein transglycosylase